MHSCASTHICPYGTAIQRYVSCGSWPPPPGASYMVGTAALRRLPVHAILFGPSPSAAPRLHLRRQHSLRFPATSTPLWTPGAVLITCLLCYSALFSGCARVRTSPTSLPTWTSTTPPCAASRARSFPCPPRRHPGKGEGYMELEDDEDDDALLVPIVPSGAERPSLPCPALS